MSEKVKKEHVERRAILYVRQSSLSQVEHNTESRRLQYGMQSRLKELGFNQIEVIDEDQGVTASGTAERRGFERVVAEVCLGRVGGVAARQVCRLARNNMDWHRLVEMCRYVNTLVIDQENVYDPKSSNDRLLLGMKGNVSTYELDVLRQRASDAARSKARRGELYLNVPAGYIKGGEVLIEKNPDLRIQRALKSVFDKFLQIGSVRQTVLWYWEHELELPVNQQTGRGGWETVWRRPTTSSVSRILNNPIFAGAYAYGRKKSVCEVREGVVKKYVRVQEQKDWEVLIRDQHEGYISWETFERIREMLAGNACFSGSPGAARGGSSVLVGLIRCGRCGRKMQVTYAGEPRLPRYACQRGGTLSGTLTCLSFGGKFLEEAVVREVVYVVSPGAIEAARLAEAEMAQKREEVVEVLQLDLEAARYAVEHAKRQYDAVDPANRLVAAELERRWESALVKVEELERRVVDEHKCLEKESVPFEDGIMALAEDLPRVWKDPQTDVRLKKRIVRALIEEVVVDVDEESNEIRAVINWKGGVHTELCVPRRRRGEHGKSTSKDIVDAVRVLSRVCSDSHIAQVLSRNGLRTGKGNPWSRERVKWLRNGHEIPVYTKKLQAEEGWMTLGQAAKHVGVSPKTLRLAVERGNVEGLHPLPHGPWLLNRTTLDTPEVKEVFANVRPGRKPSSKRHHSTKNLTIPFRR